MRHPALLGLAIGMAAAIAALVGYRHWAETPHETVDAGVRVGQLWATNLHDLDGQAQALRQWQGQVLVLNFWAPWCPPCRKEIPGFIRLHHTHAGRGLRIVGIALDAPDKVAAYVHQAGIDYPILLGAEAAEVGRAAGNQLGGLPYTLVLDRGGNPVAQLTGAVDAERLESIVRPLL